MAQPGSEDALNTVLDCKHPLAQEVEPWSDWLNIADVNAIVTNAGLVNISNQAITQP